MQRARQRGYTCPDTHKPGYPTEHAAAKAARWLRSHDKHKSWHVSLEAYQCPQCRQWHHTSSRPRPALTASLSA